MAEHQPLEVFIEDEEVDSQVFAACTLYASWAWDAASIAGEYNPASCGVCGRLHDWPICSQPASAQVVCKGRNCVCVGDVTASFFQRRINLSIINLGVER